MPNPTPDTAAAGIPPLHLDVAAEDLVDPAIDLVAKWLDRAAADEHPSEARTSAQLQGLVEDPAGVAFALAFIDRVIRPDDQRAAAHQLAGLARSTPTPAFLSTVDRLLLQAGARLAPILPRVVVPLARRRMRDLVGHLVVDAEPTALARHLAGQRSQGYSLNVNPLGEAVLGDAEADRRLEEAISLVARPDVDYVSVKVSSVTAQLEPWAFDVSVDRVSERLRRLFLASATSPPTFVNLDMEEYRDLELTVAVFRRLLDEPELHHLDAGIVFQAYLPDTITVLNDLIAWASARHAAGGGTVKVRLVKGANLAMERVEAGMHDWPQAPYRTKAEVDANYKRCLDQALRADRLTGVRIGVASHNLFDVAWAHLLAEARGVAERVSFEMLQGMAPAQARLVRDAGGGLLLYTPVVAPADFDVAIGYLVRRVEENASADNFLRHLFSLRPGTPDFDDQADRFRRAVADREAVPVGPRRTQDRGRPPEPTPLDAPFANEPDTDPVLPANRQWLAEAIRSGPSPLVAPLLTDTEAIDAVVARSVAAGAAWARRPLSERHAVLSAVADELASRRGELLVAMATEAGKTPAEADPEISEAIDFARWYAQRCLELDSVDGATFDPYGVVVVTPPWNFPVAIPAGGVLVALAAGNAVVFKPAPETPRCAEIVAEAAWAAGVEPDVLQFIRCPDNEVGRHLVSHPSVGAVVLTGAFETARLFRSWAPKRPVLAETSGKNGLVITPHADLDLAVADLVRSAFGHAGQKCSAASLAICVGDVYDSERFRRQLVDAVRSIVVGPALDAGVRMGPVISEPGERLHRALTTLDPGEGWLVEPRQLDQEGRVWSPGVKDGVKPGSWFHQNECFGPVLGLVPAADLDEAIDMQNGTPFGLTGGISSLDPAEVDHWLERAEVGNAYVNRHITGAIVCRQPFGGWKRSAVGAGLKAGGPNYLLGLGRWTPAPLPLVPQPGLAADSPVAGLLAELVEVLEPDDAAWVRAAAGDDERWWATEYGIARDRTGLVWEQNVLRYRTRPEVIVRVAAGAPAREIARLVLAAVRAGAEPVVSAAGPSPVVSIVSGRIEHDRAFRDRLKTLPGSRVRVVGVVDPELWAPAAEHDVDLFIGPVTPSGRIEMLTFLREQAISRTMHRFGNLLGDAGH